MTPSLGGSAAGVSSHATVPPLRAAVGVRGPPLSGGGDGLLCGGIKKGPHIGGLGLLVYTHIYHVSAVFFQRIRLKHNCSRKIVEVLDVLPQSTR